MQPAGHISTASCRHKLFVNLTAGGCNKKNSVQSFFLRLRVTGVTEVHSEACPLMVHHVIVKSSQSIKWKSIILLFLCIIEENKCLLKYNILSPRDYKLVLIWLVKVVPHTSFLQISKKLFTCKTRLHFNWHW